MSIIDTLNDDSVGLVEENKKLRADKQVLVKALNLCKTVDASSRGYGWSSQICQIADKALDKVREKEEL